MLTADALTAALCNKITGAPAYKLESASILLCLCDMCPTVDGSKGRALVSVSDKTGLEDLAKVCCSRRNTAYSSL